MGLLSSGFGVGYELPVTVRTGDGTEETMCLWDAGQRYPEQFGMPPVDGRAEVAGAAPAPPAAVDIAPSAGTMAVGPIEGVVG